MKKIIGYIIISYCSISSVLAQDLFSENNTLKYAGYLYDNYEYALAEPEYQRLFFTNLTDSLASTRYFICNYKLEEFEKNTRLYESYITRSAPQLQVVNEVYLRSLILLNDERIDSLLPLFELPSLNYNTLSHYMINGKWDKARNTIDENDSYYSSSFYQSVLDEQLSYNYKNPGVAIALSTIIPGAGKAYAGYWQDALFSFVFVSLSAWQSYRGFDQKGTSSVYGWLYGGMGLGFYLGNIFGSAKAVNKYNYELDHHLQHEARDIYINSPLQ